MQVHLGHARLPFTYFYLNWTWSWFKLRCMVQRCCILYSIILSAVIFSSKSNICISPLRKLVCAFKHNSSSLTQKVTQFSLTQRNYWELSSHPCHTLSSSRAVGNFYLSKKIFLVCFPWRVSSVLSRFYIFLFCCLNVAWYFLQLHYWVHENV